MGFNYAKCTHGLVEGVMLDALYGCIGASKCAPSPREYAPSLLNALYHEGCDHVAHKCVVFIMEAQGCITWFWMRSMHSEYTTFMENVSSRCMAGSHAHPSRLKSLEATTLHNVCD